MWLLQRLTGSKSFWAWLCPTATAMAGVTSPSRESADKMPRGPMIKSASRQATSTGFSPVAPKSAPALSMAAVAVALVPMAYSSQLGSCSLQRRAVTRLPILPPWPSITTIFINPPFRDICTEKIGAEQYCSAQFFIWLSRRYLKPVLFYTLRQQPGSYRWDRADR